MELIGRQIDHYRIDGLLGEGGMGAVYRAYDLNLARPVALKVMHRQFASQSEFQQRFMQEAQAAARLSHPNIAAVHNFGTASSFFYMVMEFIPGGSLNAYLTRLQERNQLLPLEETLPVLAQVADALGYAHRQGVVHRDVKPDNIILRPLEEPDREGEPPVRAVVTDFGLAKLMEGGMHTHSGTFMGTLPYMSPEQALGKPLDGRSDLYSLGVLLYQLATGRLPFDIKTPTEAVMKHINETPPTPRSIRPGLPRTIERIILRAIAKEPAARYQTGEEFARTLRQAAANLTAEEVSGFAPPETMMSLATRLVPGDERAVEPSRAGYDLTLLPGEERLLIARQGEAPRTFPLEKPTVLIGRSPDADLFLSDDTIGRHHARLEQTQTTAGARGWQIIDLGSPNGTNLNNRRLQPNIPTSLLEDQPLQIGPYVIRWQRGATVSTPLVTGTPTGRRTAMVVPAGGSQVLSQSGQLGVVVHPAVVTVAPGGRADVQVELLNQGYSSDHFRLTVVGLPPEWVSVSQDTAQVVAGGQGVLNVTIHPPQDESVIAGARPYQLIVASTVNPAEVATIPGQLTVRAVERFLQSFLLDIRPERVPNDGLCRVLVRNEGNTPTSYIITALDPAGAIDFDNQRAQLDLAPGMRGTMDVRLSARNRPLTGSPRLLPFEIQAATPAGQRQVKEGQLEVRPTLPGWLLPVLGLLTLCLCITIGSLYAIYGPPGATGAATQTAEALAGQQTASAATQIALIAQQTAAAAQGTGVAATATAEAAELAGDDDNDGLSNNDEERAGTDRGKADTDEDDLSDGEEVNQYGTDPLNRDSDGDALNDGDEVKEYRTAPSNPDSDGDGVDDGTEIAQGRNPLLPDTPTPTQAPPTNTPTATQPATSTSTSTPTPITPVPATVVLPSATPSPIPASPTSTNVPPTPSPTVPSASTAPRLAYIDGGQPRLMSLEFDDDLWQAGSDSQLADVANAVSLKISPNGQKVAFMAEIDGGNNQLFVVNTDGSGLASLVNSADLPPAPGNNQDTARILGSYQWLADNQTVAFNTFTVNLIGPGVLGNEDLWTVAAGQDPIERFEPGLGGGAFDISAANRVVMSNDTEIVRANLDGSDRQVLITFEFINTASEYIYYPIPRWADKDEFAHVAIPSPDPFSSDAEAALWQIPTAGGPEFLSNLAGNILFQPVYWTNTAGRLAYVRQVVDQSNPPQQLYLGNGEGFDLQPYGDDASQLTFLDWSSDGSHFLYAEQDGNLTVYVGTPGQNPIEADVPGNQVLAGRWLTNSTYVILSGNGNSWGIYSGNLTGEIVDLTTADGLSTALDVWSP